jgi:hypothetical protein
LARNNPHNAVPFPAELVNRFDYNRDCRVSAVDQILARNNITTGATKLQLIAAPAIVPTARIQAQGLAAVFDNVTAGEPIAAPDKRLFDMAIGKDAGELANNQQCALMQDIGITTEAAARPLSRRRQALRSELVDQLLDWVGAAR